MPSLTMGGFDIEGCIPICIVIFGILFGGFIVYLGASTGNSLVMLAGFVIVFGVITLAGKGHLKFSV